MKTNFEKIAEWHEIFDNGYKDPKAENRERVLLRGNLMWEELQEVFKELGLCFTMHIDLEQGTYKISVINDNEFEGPVDRAKVGKELADLLYVTYGSGDTMNLPMDEIYNEVHRSNMSKLGPDGKPIYRDDGKILKGPNYSPADIESVLNASRKSS